MIQIIGTVCHNRFCCRPNVLYLDMVWDILLHISHISNIFTSLEVGMSQCCRYPVKFFFFLPFLPISTSSRMHRNGYIMNGKYFILDYIQQIVDSYRYFYIIFLKLSFNNNKM